MAMMILTITPGTFGVPQSEGPKLTTPINCHLSQKNDDNDKDDDDDDNDKL